MRSLVFLLIIVFATFGVGSQNSHPKEDSVIFKQFFHSALSGYEAYNNLEYLCKKFSGRLAGTPEAAGAVDFTHSIMRNMNFDTVYSQSTIVENWRRGNAEKGEIISKHYGNKRVRVCALGKSIGTGFPGLSKNVIEIADIDELKNTLSEKIEGKIVFFNKPFSVEHYNTFISYGEVASSRYHGAFEAAIKGASAVIVRSLTHAIDTFPHTGSMEYRDDVVKIPAFAISTSDANILSGLLKKDPQLLLYLESHCHGLKESVSYNVIGEIKGSEFPDKIITVGAHLDSWDITEGAHDDGAGCIQSIEVARLFFELDIKPRHTIRIVMFMDEEMGQRGARTYSDSKRATDEEHYFALESDRGGFTPRGFSIDADSAFFDSIGLWKDLFKIYGMYEFDKGYSGVDISFLKKYNIPLVALSTDMQRYFDYQHSASDTFETVNHRELQLGSAAIAAFVFFIDKYGY